MSSDSPPIEVQRLDGRHVLHRMGLHGHTFFEVIYVERGGGPHRVRDTAQPTEAGSVFVIAPGELHDWSAVGRPCEGWVLLFTQEALDGVALASRADAPTWPVRHAFLSPFFDHANKRPTLFRVPDADRKRWSDRFRALAQELIQRPTGYRVGAVAHLHLMLLDILRLAAPSGERRADALGDARLDAAFDFIERSYAKPISARDVARVVGRSAAYLTTFMRLRTGLTLGEWIKERRMAEARRLLIATPLDLAAIADRAGYSDANALARAFRRAHRLTPAAWRKTNRGEAPT